MRARISTAAIGAILVLLSGHAAYAATMGTPLGTGQFAGAPNNPYDCTQYDTRIGGVFPILQPTGATASSCIWIDSPASNPAAAFTPQAYGVSTVTRVRVAVGQTTGPMEIVVMRSLYENTATPGKPLYACCTLVTASPPFTPQAASVTAVDVNLPMREDPTPAAGDLATIATWDVLGLAVLEPGVPVPMYDIGDQTTSNVLWNTATPSTQTPSYYSDTDGFWVAMDADYAAGGGATGHAIALGGASVAPRLGGEISLLSGSHAHLTGACPIALLCLGEYLPL